MQVGVMSIDKKTLADFESLSYYELSDLILATYSTLIEQLSVLLTVVFAYFVIAYLIAKKLSAFQLASVTIVYSGFCLVALAGYLNLTVRLWDLVYFRDGEVSIALYVSAAVCIFGWLLSLSFMFYTRYKSEL